MIWAVGVLLVALHVQVVRLSRRVATLRAAQQRAEHQRLTALRQQAGILAQVHALIAAATAAIQLIRDRPPQDGAAQMIVVSPEAKGLH